MAFTTNNVGDHLIRAELWSNQLKDILQDELMASSYVRWLTEFPDGNTFTIPSVGEAQVNNIQENVPVEYSAMDTGEFNFSISEYIGSAHYITQKALQDAFYAQELMSMFVPKERRAIEEKLETDILALSAKQTLSNANVINGANHRFVASGTNEVMDVKDFALAKFALKKANVPLSNLVAIVDPSVAYTLETLTNLVNVSNNPQWEGIITTGLTSGMRFIRNIFGFDVYESNYLATANETIGAKTTAAGVANMFFSAEASVTPFIGAWRQMPTVYSEFNKDLLREEYLTVARYGLGLYRPENLVVVLSDTDQVA